jgi:REP element-mobilizing transposase RayT
MKPDQKPIPRDACHFLTLNVVERIDVFVRPAYKQVITRALNHFIELHGVNVYAWCLMSSHLHLLIRTKEGYGPAWFERDFKKYTTPLLLKAIQTEADLRRDWILERFEEFGKSLKRIEKYHLWQTCNSPLHIDGQQPQQLLDKIEEIHENPVRHGIVDQPENYLYSSARDYAGLRGPVHVTVIQPAAGTARFKRISAN